VPHEDGDVNTRNGGNSKASERVRHADRKARLGRRVGDWLQASGDGAMGMPRPRVERIGSRALVAGRCDRVHDSAIERREVDETREVRRVFQRRVRLKNRLFPHGFEAHDLAGRIAGLSACSSFRACPTTMMSHNGSICMAL
jgi:hypothetical protein